MNYTCFFSGRVMIRLVLLCLSCVLFCNAGVGQNLVINGDFETGALEGWMSEGNVGASDGYHVLGDGNFPPCVEDFVGSFSGGDDPNDGKIWQIISVRPNLSHTISLKFGSFGGAPFGQMIGVLIEDEISGGLILDETLSDGTTTNDLPDVFDSYSFSFVPESETIRLQIEDLSAFTINVDALIDSIQLEQEDVLGDVNCDG